MSEGLLTTRFNLANLGTGGNLLALGQAVQIGAFGLGDLPLFCSGLDSAAGLANRYGGLVTLSYGLTARSTRLEPGQRVAIEFPSNSSSSNSRVSTITSARGHAIGDPT